MIPYIQLGVEKEATSSIIIPYNLFNQTQRGFKL